MANHPSRHSSRFIISTPYARGRQPDANEQAAAISVPPHPSTFLLLPIAFKSRGVLASRSLPRPFWSLLYSATPEIARDVTIDFFALQFARSCRFCPWVDSLTRTMRKSSLLGSA